MAHSIQSVVLDATARLNTAGIEPARLTAELLLAHVLGQPRLYLVTHAQDALDAAPLNTFNVLLARRLAFEPTQYITGTQEFYGRDFRVTPAVLIPRPETEHLVEAALDLVRTSFARSDRPTGDPRSLRLPSPERERGGRAQHPRILDIGTGSGAIAITLALELSTHVEATDISAAALEVARANAAALYADCAFAECDLGSCFEDASFDLAVSNPPYVSTQTLDAMQREVRDHEPHTALFAGSDGLAIYRRLIPEAARLLRPGGALLLEIGSDQGASVPALFDAQWCDVRVTKDLAGLDRVVAARRIVEPSRDRKGAG